MSLTQQKYEVRFDWGAAGLARIAPEAGILVLVDALAAHPERQLVDAAAVFAVPVLRAGLTDRTAFASWALAHQESLGARSRVAVVAQPGPEGGFAVENVLAAGAVIDALAAVGIDYSSPEAAAACAAFTALKRAVGHLFTASTAGQALIEAGRRDEVLAAAAVDSTSEATVLIAR